MPRAGEAQSLPTASWRCGYLHEALHIARQRRGLLHQRLLPRHTVFVCTAPPAIRPAQAISCPLVRRVAATRFSGGGWSCLAVAAGVVSPGRGAAWLGVWARWQPGTCFEGGQAWKCALARVVHAEAVSRVLARYQAVSRVLARYLTVVCALYQREGACGHAPASSASDGLIRMSSSDSPTGRVACSAMRLKRPGLASSSMNTCHCPGYLRNTLAASKETFSVISVCRMGADRPRRIALAI
jgi:hypothetical protein